MKKIQVVVSTIYRFSVPDNFDYTDDAEVQNAVGEYLMGNNIDAQNEFYENMKVVCADCGVSLQSDDEELKKGKCLQCQEERK